MRIEFDRPDEVVHIQTHTSHVFLTGDEVVKVKKPVDFSFLDYSTLAKRKECCKKEVALNRRFSPEVYLGVLPLYAREDGALSLSGEGEPAEWAVHMRRLPQEAMLARRLEAGDIREEEMVALADRLGAFYASAETSMEIAAFGSPEQVGENTVENFDTTLDFPEELFPDLCRRLLRESNRRFRRERTGLFLERVSAGRVLDGHGDLKPENIFLTGDGPVVTDCIEFNERFRYGDVLVDLAYLTMGLREAGREDLRTAVLDRYRERWEPDFPAELLEYYEVYRAVVKGKIEGFRAGQAEVPAEEREDARRIARRHFGLARDIVLGGRPVLAILCGVTGAGKSALAPVLVAGLDAGYAESDRTRKELAGIPPEERVTVPYGEGIYSAEMTEKTYAEMRRRAREALAGGRSFVLDATHLTPDARRAAFGGAEGLDAITVVVGVEASEAALREHEGAREGDRGASDGREEIRGPQRDLWQRPEPGEADVVVNVDASGDVAKTRAQLARGVGEGLAAL